MCQATSCVMDFTHTSTAPLLCWTKSKSAPSEWAPWRFHTILSSMSLRCMSCTGEQTRTPVVLWRAEHRRAIAASLSRVDISEGKQICNKKENTKKHKNILSQGSWLNSKRISGYIRQIRQHHKAALFVLVSDKCSISAYTADKI